MSGHADTIRTALTFTDTHSERYALEALAALLAENQRLRDVEDAARAISQWDANLIRAQCPPELMNALDQALNEVDRGREALVGEDG